MKFLQATQTLKNSKPTLKKNLLVLSSGQTETLDIYFKAEFALLDTDCQIEHIEFNTLEQSLLTDNLDTNYRATILFPWDFLPALDWRTGFPASPPDLERCLENISKFSNLLHENTGIGIFINAPLPAIFPCLKEQKTIYNSILSSVFSLGFNLLDQEVFNQISYLNSGVAVSGKYCGLVAETIVKELSNEKITPHKVLVTDLDNVMWRGVIGEDGLDGIEYQDNGTGYSHFIYQTYLKKLLKQGILLAVVSKNDLDLAIKPFLTNDMVLDNDDFVSIMASYAPKSSLINKLSEALNLPTSSFVFVDDNIVEIEEVSTTIPNIKTILFPSSATDLPSLFDQLASCFETEIASDEDLNRTILYKTRMKGLLAPTEKGADLTNFLESLSMEIEIYDRSESHNERALQLINKTNQFNINGKRLSREELKQYLQQGYRIITASVSDCHGSHGEVLACIIDDQKVIQYLVMSCRVFQRRIEIYFLYWLSSQSGILGKHPSEILLAFKETERNTPVLNFLNQNNIRVGCDLTRIDTEYFCREHAKIETLFDLKSNISIGSN